MNSDSGHGAKSLYFPLEYAFTQNQKQRSRSARKSVHDRPEYALSPRNLERELQNYSVNISSMNISLTPFVNFFCLAIFFVYVPFNHRKCISQQLVNGCFFLFNIFSLRVSGML
jgi:hypothetical protein